MKPLIYCLLIFFLPLGEWRTLSSVCLNQEEKLLYDLLMRYRAQQKLPSIPVSSKLTRVAQLHARDLADHYDPAESRCNIHSWSPHGEWQSCCYTSDHQQASCMWDKPREIAGYTGNGFEIAYYSSAGANAREGMAGWKVSPGHNQVIINQGNWKKVKWKAIGVGMYKEFGVVWFGEVADDETAKPCK